MSGSLSAVVGEDMVQGGGLMEVVFGFLGCPQAIGAKRSVISFNFDPRKGSIRWVELLQVLGSGVLVKDLLHLPRQRVLVSPVLCSEIQHSVAGWQSKVMAGVSDDCRYLWEASYQQKDKHVIRMAIIRFEKTDYNDSISGNDD
ncbi:hypothetical protein Tco_1447006 [Tanacetum coccineum]